MNYMRVSKWSVLIEEFSSIDISYSFSLWWKINQREMFIILQFNKV